MVRHCFTLDQQQKITKSKYITDKGYGVLDESNSDDIINTAAEEGIFDTTLGLSERERRSAIAGKGHDASEIVFGEAKEGAVEAHNFSSSMSITTIHSKNVNDSKSVASQKTLAKSVFSVGTSKITSNGSDEVKTDKDEGSGYEGSATKTPAVEIEGMQMLTREQSKNKSRVSGLKEKSGEYQQVFAPKDEAQLTTNMNNATAKLNLSSVNGDQDMEGDVKVEEDEFDDAMEREVDSELDTSYVVQCSDLPDLSFEVDPDSDNEEGKDFSEEDLSAHPEDHSLGQDYYTSSEVSSGVFDANYANTFEEPDSFKELLWNIAGPSVGGMIILLELLKDDLEVDEAGLPAEFTNIPATLLALLDEEAGKECGKQIEFIEEILESLDKISHTNSHDEASNPDEGTNEEASKTQGTLPQRRPPLSLPPRQDGTRRERNPQAWRPLDNRRRPSMGAAADGGGTSSTAANRTTTAPR